MRPLKNLALLGLIVWGSGCFNVCPFEETLPGPDGGQLSCVLATDCPRPSNVLVCSNTDDELRDCVGCLDARCVRYRPKACR